MTINSTSHPLLQDRVVEDQVFYETLYVKASPLGYSWPGWGVLFAPSRLIIRNNTFYPEGRTIG